MWQFEAVWYTPPLMKSDDKSYLTKGKYDELSQELEHLKTDKRRDIAKKIEDAKAFGDLSENAEYHSARDEQANTEHRIVELEMILKNAEVVEKHHTDKVEIGSVVKVEKAGGAPRTYQIVGSEEADTATGKLSNESPLGAALMHKKKGETFTFQSPAGEVKYTVLHIE